MLLAHLAFGGDLRPCSSVLRNILATAVLLRRYPLPPVLEAADSEPVFGWCCSC